MINKPFVFLFLIIASTLKAQERLQLPVVVSFFHESISLPASRMGIKRPVHLGVKIGTEIYWRQRRTSDLFQTVDLRYYYHRTMHHHLSLISSVGYRKKIGSAFVDAAIGAGYGLQFLDQKAYKSDGDGNFSVQRQPVLKRFMTNLSVGGGYTLPGNTFIQNIFTRYELLGQSPFNNEVFIVPATLLHVGTTIKTIR